MKIIIAGCGKVGQSIVQELSHEGHEITVIDTRAEKVQNMVREYDVMGYIGSAMDHEILQEAGVSEADLMIAMTGNDELNMLCCAIARRAGKLKTIARVRNPEYTDSTRTLQEDLGLSMIINPDLDAAREIYRDISLPPSVSSESFCKDAAEIFKLKVAPESVLAGMPVRDIPARLKADILVCVIERNGKAYIPDGDFVIQPKDLISIAGSQQSRKEFFKKIKVKSSPVNRLMIVGAGKVGYYLCKMLKKSGRVVTLIDVSLPTCEKMAALLPEVNVIYGNGSDQSLLREEGLDQMDAFVALTGIDEENIILSLYVSSQYPIKTITKINRIAFDDVISALDLDTIINPKKLTAENILRYVRSMASTLGSNVETIHRLAHNKVEALEFYIRHNSKVTQRTLAALPIKKGCLIALIIRGGKTILPRGQDKIFPGDNVIVITGTRGFTQIEDILEEEVLR